MSMFEAMGATDIRTFKDDNPPGLVIHETGTARMGRDPKTSVLNAHNQMWDVPNVFVTDGACMPSTANQNPSITYMALTARAVDYAHQQGMLPAREGPVQASRLDAGRPEGVGNAIGVGVQFGIAGRASLEFERHGVAAGVALKWSHSPVAVRGSPSNPMRSKKSRGKSSSVSG